MNNSDSPGLTPPVSERDHSKGSDNAPVTLVEYGDFECPDCGRAYPIVTELQKRLGDRLRFVYRHYPLMEMHPHAEHAAEVAEAAGAQGKFWQMYDYLFQHQKELDDAHLQTDAEVVGLDVERFDREMTDEAYVRRVEEDIESGDQSGVEGTPTFFINGAPYEDSYDLETFQAALERAAR